jgi:hypothetical protein
MSTFCLPGGLLLCLESAEWKNGEWFFGKLLGKPKALGVLG